MKRQHTNQEKRFANQTSKKKRFIPKESTPGTGGVTHWAEALAPKPCNLTLDPRNPPEGRRETITSYPDFNTHDVEPMHMFTFILVCTRTHAYTIITCM